MLLSLCAILEPPASLVGTRRAHDHAMPPERDVIPVITTRGRTLTVRPVAPGDAPLLAEMLARLSEHSMQLRFFRPLRSSEALWREVARVAGGDPWLRVAVAATLVGEGAECVVALAELVHDDRDPAVAEIAIVVRDDYQQEGIGRMLIQILVQLAMLRGVRTLRATMLAENQASRKLVYGLGVPYTAQTQCGETTALLRLPPSEQHAHELF
jgi:RimJ/RimL family protein N-acetyltransferase